jgi:hypothetical protein
VAIEASEGASGEDIAAARPRWPDEGGAPGALLQQRHRLGQDKPIQSAALPSRGHWTGHGGRSRLWVRRPTRGDGAMAQVHAAFLLPTGCGCSAAGGVAGAVRATGRRGHGTRCAEAWATQAAVPRCGSNVTRTCSAVGGRGARRAMTASSLPLGERSLDAPVLERGTSQPVTIPGA